MFLADIARPYLQALENRCCPKHAKIQYSSYPYGDLSDMANMAGTFLEG